MWRVLIFLALATLAALGAVWLADRPGEVSILWGGYAIETSVAVAAIGVVALAMLLLAAWSLLRFLLGLPTAFSFASKARKKARGYEAISRGMVAVGAGDPAAARRHASDARKLIASEPLTLLLSAQAAQLSGDKPSAEAAFKAMLAEPATRVLGLRGLFVEARRRGDQVAARTFADEAVRLSPSLAWANDALLEFHSTAGEWTEARTAVERRAALRLSDKHESKRHRAVLLAAEAIAKEAGDPAGALSTALEALKLAPGLIPAAALAGRLAAQKGDIRKAAKIVEAAWREQPHPDLAEVYLHLRHGDTASDRLVKAEALMRLKPTDPESCFVVAEAAIEARDYARARAALQPLVAAIPTVRTCLLMARIEEGEQGATSRAREWLTRSLRAPRDQAWVADGVIAERWMPVSPVSGRLDAFAWTLPPAVLGAAQAALPPFDAPAPSAEPAPPLIEASLVTASPVTAPPPAAPFMAPQGPSAGQLPGQFPGQMPAAAVAGPAAQPLAANDPGAAAQALGARPPDDPGPDPEPAPAPAKRGFWGGVTR
jgi:HemY protein